MLCRALATPRLWLFSVILWALALYMLSALLSVAPFGGATSKKPLGFLINFKTTYFKSSIKRIANNYQES